MRRYPVAFVDESFIHPQGHPGYYLLAAVLAEGDEVDTIVQAARSAANGAEFHSADLYRRGHVGAIEDMLDTVERHAAWTAVVAHTPLGPSSEMARQTSLRQLLTYLDKQKIRDVILDTRGSPTDWQEARERGRKVPDIDRLDVRSYRHLVTNREISSHMRLIHLDDREQPGLWMADAVAWAAHRALSVDEPQWWFRIADAATLLEATTGAELLIQDNRAAPPVGEHGPRQTGQSARPVLLPTSLYAQAADRSHGVRVGQFLGDLLDQAEQARAPDIAHQLLAAVQGVTASVTELLEEIRQHSAPPGATTTTQPTVDTDAEPDDIRVTEADLP
jgi:hypothetical protein